MTGDRAHVAYYVLHVHGRLTAVCDCHFGKRITHRGQWLRATRQVAS